MIDQTVMTASIEIIWKLTAIFLSLYFGYLLTLIFLKALKIAIFHTNRLAQKWATQLGEALGLLVVIPSEAALEVLKTLVERGRDYRTQRKEWWTNARDAMSWEDFRKHAAASSWSIKDDFSEAVDLLGLPSKFQKKDLDAKFQHIMKAIHPDKGGSIVLAAMINDARAVILNHKGWAR